MRGIGVWVFAMSFAACLSERAGTVGDTSSTDTLHAGDTSTADTMHGGDTSPPADTSLVPTDTAVGPWDTVIWPSDTSVGPFDTSIGAVDAMHDTAVGSDTLAADAVGPVDTWSSADVVTIGCPEAVIRVQEGEEVVPQTVLHLSGLDSHGLSPIVAYEWTVQQPSGSASVFLPNANHPSPSFEANVVGQYIFHLRVVDAEGRPSCQVATYIVYVTAVDAIHIELLWSTPGDSDETDTGFTTFGESVGSDLDLHFLHPNGVDAAGTAVWFNAEWDCFWSNTDPTGWPGGTASLDRDDTDGAGPENTNFSSPQVGLTYRIGVHYWDDWGYGDSFATVRVYVYGALVFEVGPTQLVSLDLWDVGTIAWPGGAVTPNTGPDAILPEYEVPFF